MNTPKKQLDRLFEARYQASNNEVIREGDSEKGEIDFWDLTYPKGPEHRYARNNWKKCNHDLFNLAKYFYGKGYGVSSITMSNARIAMPRFTVFSKTDKYLLSMSVLPTKGINGGDLVCIAKRKKEVPFTEKVGTVCKSTSEVIKRFEEAENGNFDSFSEKVYSDNFRLTQRGDKKSYGDVPIHVIHDKELIDYYEKFSVDSKI